MFKVISYLSLNDIQNEVSFQINVNMYDNVFYAKYLVLIVIKCSKIKNRGRNFNFLLHGFIFTAKMIVRM